MTGADHKRTPWHMKSTCPYGITLGSMGRAERAVVAKEQLLDLFDRYPLDKWLYTEAVRIEEGVVPHSHPILTLSPQTRGTDYLADSERLLGTYLHEQLHWFLLLEDKVEASKSASAEFRSLYPDLPTERPEGCGSDRSNYLHIQVNYLEYRALRELLGEAEAKAVIARVPYYTAVYALVLRDYEQIGKLMTRYDLIPDEQPPEFKRFVTTLIR